MSEVDSKIDFSEFDRIRSQMQEAVHVALSIKPDAVRTWVDGLFWAQLRIKRQIEHVGEESKDGAQQPLGVFTTSTDAS